MKKYYQKPECTAYELQTNHCLLAGSMTTDLSGADNMDTGAFGSRDFDINPDEFCGSDNIDFDNF